VSLFPAIFTLQNSRVHVSSYCCNIPSNIEATVDEALSSAATLDILNIDSNDYMSDLGETLITYSLEARVMLLKIWFCFMMVSTSLEIR